MKVQGIMRAATVGLITLALTACGGGSFFKRTGMPSDQDLQSREIARSQQAAIKAHEDRLDPDSGGSTLWDLFTNTKDPDTAVEVNKYLWQASLDVLNFLPIETVDPFTGVIVTGYGAPPGGGRAYRATIYVSDPALDARSLRVSLQGRGGAAVSPETQRAVEDAILTRAREIRIRDSKL
ncbi:DUF3576 domain-containing protein [Gemmobacter serpentinus]|uniref:DUF3576 domain-containing protein n=1 Tax=Gemmobacter serpentinus TaxID=2652247 RepID=UPI001865803F|nr:DUF3576 domain-containing protein [Gemmobacter serpentinus]